MADRSRYIAPIQAVLSDVDTRLLLRIEELRGSCDNTLLSDELRRQRRIICYRAIWAIAAVHAFSTARVSSSAVSELCQSATDQVNLDSMEIVETDMQVQHYSTSTRALQLWVAYSSVKPALSALVQTVNFQCKQGHVPDIRYIQSALKSMNWSFLFDHDAGDWILIDTEAEIELADSLSAELATTVSRWLKRVPYQILCWYIAQCAGLNAPPHYWSQTISFFPRVGHASDAWVTLGSEMSAMLDRTFSTIMDSCQAQLCTPEAIWADQLICLTYSFWKPLEPTPLLSPVLMYLSLRADHKAVYRFLAYGDRGYQIWQHMACTVDLHAGLHSTRGHAEFLAAVWRVAISLTFISTTRGSSEEVLEALKQFPVSDSRSVVLGPNLDVDALNLQTR